MEHRVLSYPIALRSVQVVHGNDPLHVAVLLLWSEELLSIKDSFCLVASSHGVPHLNESVRLNMTDLACQSRMVYDE